MVALHDEPATDPPLGHCTPLCRERKARRKGCLWTLASYRWSSPCCFARARMSMNEGPSARPSCGMHTANLHSTGDKIS